MLRRWVIVRAVLLASSVSAVPAGAEPSILQTPDGTSGRVVELGEGTKIYSDAHGNSGMVIEGGPAGQNSRIVSPQGESKTGTIFGTPAPPSGLTSPPVLPFSPHSSPLPPTTSPPAAHPPVSSGPSGFTSGAFGGRR